VAFKPKITGRVKGAQVNSSVHDIANLPSTALPVLPGERSPASSPFIQALAAASMCDNHCQL